MNDPSVPKKLLRVPTKNSVPTGVRNVTTVTNVQKMTKNDPTVPIFGSVHFYMGF